MTQSHSANKQIYMHTYDMFYVICACFHNALSHAAGGYECVKWVGVSV